LKAAQHNPSQTRIYHFRNIRRIPFFRALRHLTKQDLFPGSQMCVMNAICFCALFFHCGEGRMQRKYCSEGNTLDRLYTQETLTWGIAEAQKRSAVSIASRAEWFKVVQNAEEAKRAYEKAKCDYLDHLIVCQVCDAHVPAPPSVYAAEKRAQVKLVSILARVGNSESQPNQPLRTASRRATRRYRSAFCK
jgi:hypothetical protein